MDEITIKKSEYDELIQFKSVAESAQVNADEITKLKGEVDEQKKTIEDLTKFKAEAEEREVIALKAEAEKYVEENINAGKIIPASREYYVGQYLKLKNEAEFSVFKSDIESRGSILPANIKENGDGKVEFKNTEDFGKLIERKMKNESKSFEVARAELLRDME